MTRIVLLLLVLLAGAWSAAQIPVTVWQYDPSVRLPWGATTEPQCLGRFAEVWPNGRLSEQGCYQWLGVDPDQTFRSLVLNFEIAGYTVVSQTPLPEFNQLTMAFSGPKSREAIFMAVGFLPDRLWVNTIPMDLTGP